MKNLFLCFLIFIFLSCNTDQIIEIDNVETQNVQSVVDDVNYEQGFVRILVSWTIWQIILNILLVPNTQFKSFSAEEDG
jgi:hypothetical protein